MKQHDQCRTHCVAAVEDMDRARNDRVRPV